MLNRWNGKIFHSIIIISGQITIGANTVVCYAVLISTWRRYDDWNVDSHHRKIAYRTYNIAQIKELFTMC